MKKAEHQRIDAFELWCWRRLLRVPWAARRSSQSILKEISPGCSLEGLMLNLKLQHSGHLMWRTISLEKTLMLGNTEGRRRRGRQRMRWLGGITIDHHWSPSLTQFEQAPGAGDGQGSLACCSPRGHKELDMTKQLNWLMDVLVQLGCKNVGKESACNAGDVVQILGWEDLLEKEMAIHSIFLPGKSHGQRSLVGYSPRITKSWTRLSI